MTATAPRRPGRVSLYLAREDLDALIAALSDSGYEIVGPTVKDGAIVLDAIESAADLPVGWTDQQEPGRYRLARRSDGACFGYSVSPQAFKRFLNPPSVRLVTLRKSKDGVEIQPETQPNIRYAFLGVRACELAALRVQDRVFLGQFPDAVYSARRRHAFIIAVNCGQASPTCFCRSMRTGPRALGGYDLALTEVLEDDGEHFFVVDVGSQRGAALMQKVPARAATPEEVDVGRAKVARAANQMQRSIDVAQTRTMIEKKLESPHWKDVAARCMSCANCTLVCPTCFCSTVNDVVEIDGQSAARWRQWDSCFTSDFSYIHGGAIRDSRESRYRQWFSHKLDTWHDQFGTSGCVGCGRCITWCPVGIDITEEARALASSSDSHAAPLEEAT